MRRRLTSLFALGLLGLAACADEPGELSIEEVADLSRSTGDAMGSSFSGAYAWKNPVPPNADIACACENAKGKPVELIDGGCQILVGTVFGLGSTMRPLTLLQNDGLLSVSLTPLLDVPYVQFTGPVDADGQFSAGSVTELFSAQTGLSAAFRLDGEISDRDGQRWVEADARAKIKGAVPLDPTLIQGFTTLPLEQQADARPQMCRMSTQLLAARPKG